MSRVTNFLVGRVLAQNAGVDPTRPAVIAALVPNSVMGIVLAQFVVRSEVAALPPPSVTAIGTGGTGTGAGTGTTPQVEVPELSGDSVSEATEQLQQVGLVSAGVTGNVTAKEARGRVVSTSPAAGAVVARGSGVTLFISAGPPVPDVIGKPLDEAVERLARDGYTAQVFRRPGDPGKADLVADQTPAVGQYPPDGSTTVQLTVNARQEVPVPDLTGKTPHQARDILQGKKLVGLVAGTEQPAADEVVVQEEPPAHTLAEVGSAVTLTFGQPLNGSQQGSWDSGA